jgi:Xaa-Pro aminopeptidase
VDFANRIDRLRAQLPELEADAFLATSLANVRYLTGFTGSNGQVLLSSERGAFFTDGRYERQAAHEVPDLERVVYPTEFAVAFGDVCRQLGVSRVAFEDEDVTVGTHRALAAAGVELIPSRQVVERLRWVKEAMERSLLGDAQAIADQTFEEIIARLGEGTTERELALDIDTTMRRIGADAVSFETIVAFGESAAEPHHAPGDRALRRGDVVKMDFGALMGGYHSDMTRTVAFGEPPGRLRDVYEVVHRAQQAGIDAVRAGVSGGDVDEASRSVVREAGFDRAFNHGLGHGVGLQIHEGPNFRRGGTDVLPVGAVMTVEPGIYLDGVGGVRIEDMVEVRGDGCALIPKAPRELIVL